MAQLLNSLTASGRFLKIHHHFPECGHSFMPCDWAFAQTEKIKLREEYVFVPEEWYDIVSSFLKKFSVVRVDQDMILYFKWHLQPFFQKMIKNKTPSFTISRYWNMVCEGREISAFNEQSNVVWSKFCLFKAKQKSPHFDAPKAYHGALPFNYQKCDDVMKMAQKYVQPLHLKWYNKLVTAHGRLSQDRHSK
jgi:hypothetical protein